MEIGKTVRSKGSGTLRRRNRCGYHVVGERSEGVVEFQLMNLPDDLTCKAGLTARERGDILAGKIFGNG